MISIIVPVYNGEKSIGSCLDSILSSRINVSFELIVVNDGSTDGTESIIRRFNCRYFKIAKSGVAAARNIGIKYSKGDILFFFDADVRLRKDTIEKFLLHFENDKDIFIMQGRWDKKSPNRAFSSRFFLLKYAYNFESLFKNKRRIETGNLETGCLAIKSKVFEDFKGFHEGYKFSGGEEHELGMRILEKYRIYYYPDIFVEHAFGGLFNSLKEIYRRTINFSMLAFSAKSNGNFMNLHKVSVPLEDKISVVMVILLICAIFLLFINAKITLSLFFIVLIVYILSIKNFFIYLATEENIYFATLGTLANLLIMIPRLLGLCTAGCMFYILGKKDFKI